jgi:PRTRC genetic system ThiF family protein
MKRVHFTDKYLINPQHPVTISLVGAGGTGSQVLTCLARLDVTLRVLGHPGLFVTLYDPDEVTEANIGRQLFGYSDFGLNKAVCQISRVNNFFGNDWKAVPRLFAVSGKDNAEDSMANITITCTDNVKSRLDMWKVLKSARNVGYQTDYRTPLYWLDFGNAQTTGQAIIGTVQRKIPQPESKMYETVESLKVITQYVKYSAVKVKESGPSCSLAEALLKQDLFINSTLAQLGCNILWKMFRNGLIEHQGLYLNLNTVKVNPIPV